ncbi:DUF6350 family protein [Actinomadura atramentaria]|uniref:cell division protein PerM n=1 Tax=Actinomadura atramentaria TaxID=1990 RepID=UPI000377D3A3|nr:DUF6350 family protein [Actinomadura atramentaria]
MSDATHGHRPAGDRRRPAEERADGAAPAAGSAGPPVRRAGGPQRPLFVTGIVGAVWCVGIGLAVLITVTLIGWIAAPRSAIGHGLPGVFRTAVTFWLVAHHAGFSLEHGRVGLLPIGILVLPGALLYRCGGWMIRSAGTPRRPRRAVVDVAVALAVPYAVLAGLLALVATTKAVRPSPWQALLACLLVAFAAGGLGAARAVVAARGPRVRSGLGALLRLLPARPRALVVGVCGALGVLLAAGALLVGASLALHLPDADHAYRDLAPGIVGGVLLLLVELVFLPNAIIWGSSYAVGAGFAVGAGTSVSPSGVFLDLVPAFPPLAALPDPGPAPVVSFVALVAPFVAGAVGGVLTMRSLPGSAAETAPLWGFGTGALTGGALALLAALSGGPMGGGRLVTVGPSPWQAGLLAALEVGIAAAVAAWFVGGRRARGTDEADEEGMPGRSARRRRGSGAGGRLDLEHGAFPGGDSSDWPDTSAEPDATGRRGWRKAASGRTRRTAEPEGGRRSAASEDGGRGAGFEGGRRSAASEGKRRAAEDARRAAEDARRAADSEDGERRAGSGSGRRAAASEGERRAAGSEDGRRSADAENSGRSAGSERVGRAADSGRDVVPDDAPERGRRPVPMSAPVPADAEPPARRAKPVPAAPAALEFEDAEPVLPARRRRSAADHDEAPDPDVPRPRDDGRTENRGGAIYVLRDEDGAEPDRPE